MEDTTSGHSSRRPIVLSLCDLTTTMARPWAEAGYTVYCVDTQHKEGEQVDGNIVRVGADIRTWLPPRGDVAFVAAFPPCTDLAVSGARWFQDKGLTRRGQAIELVGHCLDIAEWSGAPYCIENPVSILSTHWRAPDHVFDPYEYGGYDGGQDDGYTKKTCLWTGNGFVMPKPKPIPLDTLTYDRIHKAAPGPDRANFRSATPVGFARAIMEANRPARQLLNRIT
jgi:hypothetical protein